MDNDDIHKIGNRVISKGIDVICEIIEGLKIKKEYKITPQNNFEKGKVFKNKDFTESSLLKYLDNLNKGNLIIENDRYINLESNLVKLKWM